MKVIDKSNKTINLCVKNGSLEIVKSKQDRLTIELVRVLTHGDVLQLGGLPYTLPFVLGT